MKTGRAIRWGLIILLGVLLGTALTLYLLANRRPADYRPTVLAAEGKEQARERLKDRVAEFVSRAGEISSYPDGGQIDPDQVMVMTVTQDEMNDWVASLPEQAEIEMARMGLREPAIALGDDRLTFYAFWAEHEKVVGIDFAFTFTPTGDLKLLLKGVRMGNLAMPRTFYDELVVRLERHIQRRLSQADAAGQESFAGIPEEQIRSGAKALVDTLGGKPVRPEIREHFGQVRITGIDLAKGLLTLRVVPLTPEGGATPAPSGGPLGGLD